MKKLVLVVLMTIAMTSCTHSRKTLTAIKPNLDVFDRVQGEVVVRCDRVFFYKTIFIADFTVFNGFPFSVFRPRKGAYSLDLYDGGEPVIGFSASFPHPAERYTQIKPGKSYTETIVCDLEPVEPVASYTCKLEIGYLLSKKERDGEPPRDECEWTSPLNFGLSNQSIQRTRGQAARR